jgi:hypothetical protein
MTVEHRSTTEGHSVRHTITGDTEQEVNEFIDELSNTWVGYGPCAIHRAQLYNDKWHALLIRGTSCD